MVNNVQRTSGLQNIVLLFILCLLKLTQNKYNLRVEVLLVLQYIGVEI